MAKKMFMEEAERDASVVPYTPQLNKHEARSRGTSRLGGAVTIAVERLEPDPDQVRTSIDRDSEEMRELATSIQAHGVLQPLTVYYRSETEVYRIVSGERRYHAAIIAGRHDVPCLVRDKAPSDAERTELQLIENLHRKGMHPLDESLAFQQLSDIHGLKHEEIAKQVGKSRSYITKSMRLCSLSVEIQEEARCGESERPVLPFEQLYQIAKQKTPEKQRDLFDSIRASGLNAKEARERARDKSKKGNRAKGAVHRYVNERFSVTVKFKKEEVSEDEIRNALISAIDALPEK